MKMFCCNFHQYLFKNSVIIKVFFKGCLAIVILFLFSTVFTTVCLVCNNVYCRCYFFQCQTLCRFDFNFTIFSFSGFQLSVNSKYAIASVLHCYGL